MGDGILVTIRREIRYSSWKAKEPTSRGLIMDSILQDLKFGLKLGKEHCQQRMDAQV